MSSACFASSSCVPMTISCICFPELVTTNVTVSPRLIFISEGLKRIESAMSTAMVREALRGSPSFPQGCCSPEIAFLVEGARFSSPCACDARAEKPIKIAPTTVAVLFIVPFLSLPIDSVRAVP
jgi:hypothetical protein